MERWEFYLYKGCQLYDEGPLLRRLLNDVAPFLTHSRAQANDSTDIPDARESYALEVFSRTRSLYEALDGLWQSVFYVSRGSRKSSYGKRSPSQAEWVRYHLENYYMRLRGIHDRAVSLVAEVFAIYEKDGERARYTTVIEHQSLKESKKVLCSLKGIAETTFTFKDLRDAIVHERSYSDTGIHWLQLHGLVQKGVYELSGNEAWTLRRRAEQHVRVQARNLNRNCSDVEAKCRDLLRNLEPEYAARLPIVRFSETGH
jgi:hypothetical protein